MKTKSFLVFFCVVDFFVSLQQASNFQSIESLGEFLTSQERQEVILYLLNTIRAEKGDEVVGAGGGTEDDEVKKKKKKKTLKFREGEAIGKKQLHIVINTYII